MDHNLDDSLNLDSSMGMDFEHDGDVVVSQADISLDAGSHDGGMHMNFEHIEEQPILMDTGNEEIIDFMGDQFALQEYSVQDDETTSATTTEESNQQNILSSQSEPLLDIQLDTQSFVPAKQDVQVQPKYVSIKQTAGTRVAVSSPGGRAVALAPKPTPRAIAPRPVALVTSKSLVKKVPLSSVINASGKANTLLAQIGKQLVMMPHSTPKIKLVTSGSSGISHIQYIKANTSQAQLLSTKNVSSLQGAKPIVAKVIMQGQSNLDQSNQQTIITKILPSSTASAPQARYVMQQKTVPISLGNKVLLASPTKQGMKFTKKQQVISIKSPTPKLMPAPPPGTTKKVVITANPPQNVILKTTAPPKTDQITKDGKVVVQSQRSQIHQINVPGKGIQYIRLITNQTPSTTKAAGRASVQSLSGQPKSFVLTDSKGKIIQVSSENSFTGQPTQVIPGNSGNKGLNRQQKFVRIASAPAVPKPTTVTTASMRSSQSLLAPLSPVSHSVKLEDPKDPSPVADEQVVVETQIEEEFETEQVVEHVDTKTSLQALIADAVEPDLAMQEVEVDYADSQQSSVESENQDSMDALDAAEGQEEHPLIVIPSNYIKNDPDSKDEYSRQDDSSMLNLEGEVLNTFVESPETPQAPSEGDVVIKSDFGLRPRRACNCTKSQCLKLYCDCFANGEFCNRCNCNNCYNNLNYEELRQKAIRACLERNPNAFRPKIGKTKAGGPEIIRRHNKGCNCKRSGCLKNYCECYEAKIACTAMCKCFGCRNIEETLHRRRRELPHPLFRPPPLADLKQPCSFMTTEVIEAVCQCLLAASVEAEGAEQPATAAGDGDPVRLVLDEFSRCLQDIISASHHAAPHEGHS